MIRIDAIWLATEPIDMRVGMDKALARVVKVFGAARPHHAYLFTNKRSTRIKVLVYDGFGIWLASRRLNKGRFAWVGSGIDMVGLNPEQLRALVTGLPWENLANGHMNDFPGYKALFRSGITEAGCMAHARRRFHELWANHSSQIAGEVLDLFGRLYDVEREVSLLDEGQRLAVRQTQAKPVADALHQWLLIQRQRVPSGGATFKAIEYSLNRWSALIHYLNDPRVPIDNNWVENQIRPVALGRKNWMFAGSLRAGKRAAAIMSLIHSARLNGHDPYGYMKDILERLPLQPFSRINELLPHHWQPAP